MAHEADLPGFVALKLPAGGLNGSALGVSGDGHTVLGSVNPFGGDADSTRAACYWVDEGPPIIVFQDFGFGASLLSSSYDGSIILGGGTPGPFVWKKGDANVTFFANGNTSVGAISLNGNRIVGFRPVGGFDKPCYWNGDGTGQVDLPVLPGMDSGEALAVSRDGSVIAGIGYLKSDFILTAWRWSEETGVVNITIPGMLFSRAFGVSGDGKIVVGDAEFPGDTSSSAFRWTAETGMVAVSGMFSAQAISDDGLTIIGQGFNPADEFRGSGYFSYNTGGGTVIPNPGTNPTDPNGINGTYPDGVSANGVISVGFSFGSNTLPWLYSRGRCVVPDPINAADPPVTPAIVTTWSLEPDWANGVTERLLWKTDILTSQTGIEQRRRLRNAPRRQIEAAFTLIGMDRRIYDNMMAGTPAAHDWHYPLWWEKYHLRAQVAIFENVIYLDDLTGSEVTSGDILMIRGALPFASETVRVSEVSVGAIVLSTPVGRTWPKGTTVYLTKLCRLTGTQRGNRRADDAAQVTLTFDTIQPNDYTGTEPPSLGLDYPVLEITPDEAEDMTVEYKRLLQEFDNQFVSVPVRRDLAGQSFMLQQFSYFTHGRKELADLRGLLYYLEGRLVPLYVPTYARDVDILPFFFADAGTTTLAVSRSGHADFIPDGTRTRRLLLFMFRDGTMLIHTVASITVIDDGQENITVVEPFFRPVSNGLVSRICWLALSRQDQDEIEILHHADGLGPTTMTTTFATLAEGRNASPYTTDVWNGSFVQIEGEPVAPPPDGPVPPVVVDQVPLAQGDVGGREGGGDGGGDDGGGDASGGDDGGSDGADSGSGDSEGSDSGGAGP